MSALGRGRELVAETTRLSLDQSDLPGALRCTVGVLVPLLLGLTTGALSYGVAGAIGALCAGFASFQGAYRSRAYITIVVAAGMAAATLSGSFASRAGWSAVVAVAAWALVAGMMTALSQASLVVGLQWCVAVIVVNAISMDDHEALLWSLSVLAGGLIQTVLVVVVWPIRTYRTERSALAALYDELARYAGAITTGVGLGGPSTAMGAARAALRDPHPLGRPGRLIAFQALVDEAERMRIELVSLASRRRALPEGTEDGPALDSFLCQVADVLAAVAVALSTDEAPGPGASGPVEPLSPPAEAGEWLGSDLAQLSAALAGQLRSAVRTAELSAGGAAPPSPHQGARPGPARRVPGESWLTIRSNVSRQSGVFRHALRLAATLAVAMTIYRATGLAHGYWIALTALLVLRQDFSTTVVRGLSRVAGTLAGAAVAGGIVALLHPGTTGLAALFAAGACIAFVVVRVNYALFSLSVTAYVVFLLALAGEPVASTAGARLISTLIGGAVAFAAYFAWPTWESRLVGPRLAELLEAQAAYAEGVLGCYGGARPAPHRQLGELRAATRLARSNAELSVEKMASEPARSRREALISLEDARGVIAAARRGSLAILTLHAHLPERAAPELAPLGSFSLPLAEHLRHEAAELRRRLPAPTKPFGQSGPPAQEETSGDYSLRQAHQALVDSLGASSGSGSGQLPVLLAETDELVDAVNTLSRLVAPGGAGLEGHRIGGG